MVQMVRRSLLVQLLSIYLLFVIIVVIGGVGVDVVIEQQLGSDVQASDQALAQEIALETGLQLKDAEQSLVSLGKIAVQERTSAEIEETFHAYRVARSDVDYVYWLDPFGILRASWPVSGNGELGSEFEPPDVIQQALIATEPVFDVGIAAQTTFNAGVIIADPVRDTNGRLLGIVAADLSLVELSEPLKTVIQAQQHQGRHLMISIIDARGELIASPDHERILLNILNELPGADLALQGRTVSQVGLGGDGQSWLFSSVPVPGANWAVVVQRPASEALAVITQFHLWLLAAVLLFALGGLLFWLILLSQVIRPLHTLAGQHQSLPSSAQSIPEETTVLVDRLDEVGDLARSLVRLERDGLEKLSELRTLLETSNAVVSSLEPYTVVRQIIREVRRLVDVQAAVVLLPDEDGVLHVLVSEGHGEHYDSALSLTSENVSSAAIQAMKTGQPVQKLLVSASSLSYDEGFRSVLAIPIISRHAGSVFLLVHRTDPRPFAQNEIDLLLTFANYATMAWEHAVLYERSDERLREVAHENELLYRKASEEQQKLAAIMGSMSDGLVLTGTDGTILYANQGASTLTCLPIESLENQPIEVLYTALCKQAKDAKDAVESRQKLAQEGIQEFVLEILRAEHRLVIHLRLFDVNDRRGQLIGRGLLLRNVTREHELDEFKSTLLAAVGHEVRTPLSAIKGYTSTLLQEDVSWSLDDQRFFLKTISAEADRLAQLVSNLLDLSRQEAGLLLLNRVPINGADLIEKTVERLRQPGTVITLSLPENMPLVDVDGGRIEVVFHNLVSNAMAYGEGKVHLSAELRENMAIFSISDNGPGIDPDELPYIFERFYRARRGRQQITGGTGLGLTICKAFIEAHGGSIWVESCEQGTTFSFSLPLAFPATSTTIKLPIIERL